MQMWCKVPGCPKKQWHSNIKTSQVNLEGTFPHRIKLVFPTFLEMLSKGAGTGSLVVTEIPGLSYMLMWTYMLKKRQCPSQFTLQADLQGSIASRIHYMVKLLFFFKLAVCFMSLISGFILIVDEQKAMQQTLNFMYADQL